MQRKRILNSKRCLGEEGLFHLGILHLIKFLQRKNQTSNVFKKNMVTDFNIGI